MTAKVCILVRIKRWMVGPPKCPGACVECMRWATEYQDELLVELCGRHPGHGGECRCEYCEHNLG